MGFKNNWRSYLNRSQPTQQLKLDADAIKYSIEIDQNVIAKHHGISRKQIEIVAWPAVVSACCFKSNLIVHSHSKCLTNTKFDFRIMDKFNQLGGIKYGHTPGCENKLGHCAEQRAANDLLYKMRDRKRKIKDILFSKAFRPRTMKEISMCDNCCYVFDK